MAAESWRESVDLSERVIREPYRFDFFQYVRVLERVVRYWANAGARRPTGAIGRGLNPAQEAMRFKGHLSLGFPTSPVTQVRVPGGEQPVEVEVAFLGLVGAMGVMPHHYSALLLGQRSAGDKQPASRVFLDLFTHRFVSLFFRAWEKYRLPFALERAVTEQGREKDDPITWGLYCLVGMGTAGLRGRLEVPDEALLYYAGHFSHQPRNFVSLEAILEEYIGVRIEVRQLQGQWLNLGPRDLSLMGASGRNNSLGRGLVVGRRVWDIQSKFRLRLGPVGYAEYRRLMPDGDKLRPLWHLTRLYVGIDLDFDVQPTLKAEEVPACRLQSKGDRGRLGWNTWLKTRPMTRDVEDAVFRLRE